MQTRIDPRAEGSTIHRLPQVFVNKGGEAILIRTLDERVCPRLVEMYLAYQPRDSFHGLPPISDDACVRWVNQMIGNGINLIALAFEEGVVGHAGLFPIDDQVCELLVVVAPSFQNTGIGTRLTQSAIQLAYEIGFERVRLTVEARNRRARRVFKKCGFEDLPDVDPWECEMAMDLKRYHDAINTRIGAVMNRRVVTIRKDESCRTAARRFLQERVASLPVVDADGTLIGIISETDLMTPSNLDSSVRDTLTRDVLYVREDCTIGKAVRLFQSMRIRCIPVVDRDMKLIGVVSRKDILAYYERH